MARFRVLGDLVEHLTSDSCMPNTLPLKEVETREKLQEDYLNALGHICNCLYYGHDKLKSVRIVGWKPAAVSGESSKEAEIEIKRQGERYSPLEIRVSCGILPQSFYDRMVEYVSKLHNCGTLKATPTPYGLIMWDNLDESIFQEHGIDHTQEIEVIDDEKICKERGASLIIRANTPYAGYLVRDVLKALNVEVKPDNWVSVKDDRTFGDGLSDLFLGAMSIATRPVDWIDRKIEKYFGRSIFEGVE